MATTVLNTSNCGITGNVGKFFCSFNPKLIKYFLLIPKGTVIPASSMTTAAAVRAYIYAGLKNDTPGLRWKRSGLLSQMQDNTEAVKTEDKDGWKVPTQFPPYNWQWDMTLQLAQFVKWLGLSETAQDLYDLLLIDVDGNLIGTAKTDTDGAAGMGGASLFSFFLPPMKMATTEALVKFNVNMIISDNTQLNENIAMIQANIVASDWDTVLFDTLITQADANTATSIKVQVFTDGVGAKSSLLAKYGTTLASLTAWVVKKNGVVITPSAIAFDSSYDSNNGKMTFTIASLSSTDVVTVDLAAPSILTVTPFFVNAVSEGTQYSYTHP